MSAVQAKLWHRGQVKKNLWVEFWAPENIGGITSMTCEWDPVLPKKLNKKAWKNYVRERGIFLKKLAAGTGQTVLCVDT